MRMRARALAAALATAALLSLPVASAGAEEGAPWPQVLTGARPTHLQPPPSESEIQEVSTSKTDLGSFFGEVLVSPVAVGGKAVGCLGGGEFVSIGESLFHSPAAACEEQTGFPAAETAETPAELAALLEGVYETEVTLAGPEGHGEAPAGFGEGAFTLITPGAWVAPLELGPQVVIPNPLEPEQEFRLGNASATAVSEGSGVLVLTLTNLGDAPLDATSTPLEIADELPQGLVAYGVAASAGTRGEAGEVRCELPTAKLAQCSFEDKLPSYEAIEVEVPVALTGAPGAPGTVTVSGGDAADPGPVSQPVTVSEAPVPFGLEGFFDQAEEEGGAPTAAAGLNPFQVTSTLQLNSGRQEGLGRAATVAQPALPRNIAATFPLGFAGNPHATPTCPLAVFLRSFELINACPDEAALGVSSVTVIERETLGLTRIAVPVFNLPPQRGEPARLGFMAAGVPVLIDTSVDPDEHYRVTGTVRNIPQTAEALSATLSLWGVPGDPRHDSARGWGCVYFSHPGGCPESFPGLGQTPFLRMPVSCSGSLRYEISVEPWNVPIGSLIDRAGAVSSPLGACNHVPFDPRISSTMTSKLASAPSGLDFELQMPDPWPEEARPRAVSEGQAKRVEVTLPEGVTINPSQAEGLATCSPEDFARERFDSAPGEGCPEASKIGSIAGTTPLLDEPLQGALYVATPYQNPSGSLIALYIVARVPERGVLVKQAGEVSPDPRTGQLVSTFDDLPQLPYDNFRLHFREGGRSPLVTPPGCDGDPSEPGNQPFTTTARFVPWSAQDPDNPQSGEVVERTATFAIEHGVDGGPCPAGPAPFNPGFEAGTLNNQAGAYSPFLMRLTRGDGEQDMGRFSFVLPPGVVPRLAGIPYCPEAGIARAQSRQGPHGGQEEKNDPSCPSASEIGRTVAGAGVGNQLTYVPGKLYLAGPYHGDPISAVSITPAVAGPFDAGTVVVREALRLNPVTHVGEVDGSASDPIPHVLKGIPLNLRELRVYADRPEFTLNATSCEPFAAESTIWGDGTALEPLPEHPATLSSHYQAAGCASLGFKPRLAINLKGGTKRGGHPALKAVVTPRPGDANFAGAVVTLPHSAFLDQAHIRTICTRVQFAAAGGNGAGCPAGSVYGHAKAWSPLLDAPLEGPVFLRSSSHNLPDLVVALHGLIDIDLAARIDSVHGGIRSTFADVPDAPVSRFVLEMQGARKGLIVNSTDLCRGAHRATANLRGQNGRLDRIRPLVRAVKCGKAHRKRHQRHPRRAHAAHADSGGSQ